MKNLSIVILTFLPWISLAQKIVEAEYFIDDYATMGNGTSINLSEQKEEIDLNIDIDVADLTQGPHILYLRVKDEYGTWSFPYSRMFIRRANSATNPKIVSYEYVFDNINKLRGSGNVVTFEESAAEISHSVQMDVSHLAPGPHILFVRIKDETGMESFLYKQSFIKVDHSPPAKIVAFEYFFINQEGNKSELYKTTDFEPGSRIDLKTIDFALNASFLSYGKKYALHLRAVDETGVRSHFFVDSLTYRQDQMPYVVNAIPDQEVNAGESFNLTFPYENYSDPDLDKGDTLMFKAELADENPLPAWLSFDAEERLFSGTPTEQDARTWPISLIVYDLGGASVSDLFNIDVIGQNQAPVAEIAIPDQTAVAGLNYHYQFPENTFSDPEDESITLICKLSDSNALPGWLSFDDKDNVLSGIPGDSDVGLYSLVLMGLDPHQAAASIDFNLTVEAITAIPAEISNELTIYPNPADQSLYISIENNPNYSAIAKLFSITGVLEREIFVNKIDENLLELDLTTIHPGWYILTFNINNNLHSYAFLKK